MLRPPSENPKGLKEDSDSSEVFFLRICFKSSLGLFSLLISCLLTLRLRPPGTRPYDPSDRRKEEEREPFRNNFQKKTMRPRFLLFFVRAPSILSVSCPLSQSVRPSSFISHHRVHCTRCAALQFSPTFPSILLLIKSPTAREVKSANRAVKKGESGA